MRDTRGLRARRVRRLGEARRRVPMLRQRLPLRMGLPLQSGRTERHASPFATHPADRELRGPGAQRLPSTRRDDPARPVEAAAQGARGFIRILRPGINLDDDDLDLDRIDVVTASATSRLGNPISDAEQDEAGLYTKSNGMLDVADTQRRGAAGMGGRTHFWTNAYDPGENSYAQQQFETSASDVWIFYRNPDLNPDLRHKDGTPYSFNNRRERRKILEWVYAGSPWVPLDSVEAEAEASWRRIPRRRNASLATAWCRAAAHGSRTDYGRAAMRDNRPLNKSRMRTMRQYNLPLLQKVRTVGRYDMPMLAKQDVTPLTR